MNKMINTNKKENSSIKISFKRIKNLPKNKKGNKQKILEIA